MHPARCILIGLLVFAGACDNRGSSRTPAKERVVAVVARAESDPALAIMKAVAERLSRIRAGLRFEFHAPAAPSADDQRRLLEAMAPAEFQAVLVWPSVSQGLGPSIARLTREGTPVILMGHDVPDCGRSAFCGPYDREQGRVLASAVRQVVGPAGGGLGLVRGDPGDAGEPVRLAGFAEGLSVFGALSIVREAEPVSDAGEAARRLRLEISKYPRLVAWVLVDDFALQAAPINERPGPPAVKIIVWGRDQAALERLDAGAVDAVVIPDEHTMVERAMTLALEAATEGRTTISDDLIEAVVVTAADCAALRAAWRGGAAGVAASRPDSGSAVSESRQ